MKKSELLRRAADAYYSVAEATSDTTKLRFCICDLLGVIDRSYNKIGRAEAVRDAFERLIEKADAVEREHFIDDEQEKHRRWEEAEAYEERRRKAIDRGEDGDA